MNLSEENDASPARSRSILVVEDEFLIALEIKSVLTAAGFGVVGPAGSVDHALDLLRHSKPDAAVLDIDLGGERVTPVALQLKAMGVPFLLMSAADSAALAQNSALAEVRNLGKPTDMRLLTETVGGIVEAS